MLDTTDRLHQLALQFSDGRRNVYDIRTVTEARDEITRLRRIVGLLADFVNGEIAESWNTEPEKLLVKCGLAEPRINPPPGLVLTTECKRLIEEANDA